MPDNKNPGQNNSQQHEFQKVRKSLKKTGKLKSLTGEKNTTASQLKALFRKLREAAKEAQSSAKKAAPRRSQLPQHVPTPSAFESHSSVKREGNKHHTYNNPNSQNAASWQTSVKAVDNKLTVENKLPLHSFEHSFDVASTEFLKATSVLASSAIKQLSKAIVEIDLTMFPKLINRIIQEMEKRIEFITNAINAKRTVPVATEQDLGLQQRMQNMQIELNLPNLKIGFSLTYDAAFQNYFEKGSLAKMLQRHLNEYFKEYMEMMLNLYIADNTDVVERNEIVTDDTGEGKKLITSTVTHAPIVDKEKFIQEFNRNYSRLVELLMQKEAQYAIDLLSNAKDLVDYSQQSTKSRAEQLLSARKLTLRNNLEARGSSTRAINTGTSNTIERTSKPLDTKPTETKPVGNLNKPVTAKFNTTQEFASTNKPKPINTATPSVYNNPPPETPVVNELPNVSAPIDTSLPDSIVLGGLGVGGFAGPLTETHVLKINELELKYSIEPKFKKFIQDTLFIEFLRTQILEDGLNRVEMPADEKLYKMQHALNRYIRKATDFLHRIPEHAEPDQKTLNQLISQIRTDRRSFRPQ